MSTPLLEMFAQAEIFRLEMRAKITESSLEEEICRKSAAFIRRFIERTKS